MLVEPLPLELDDLVDDDLFEVVLPSLLDDELEEWLDCDEDEEDEDDCELDDEELLPSRLELLLLDSECDESLEFVELVMFLPVVAPTRALSAFIVSCIHFCRSAGLPLVGGSVVPGCVLPPLDVAVAVDVDLSDDVLVVVFVVPGSAMAIDVRERAKTVADRVVRIGAS